MGLKRIEALKLTLVEMTKSKKQCHFELVLAQNLSGRGK